MKMHSLTHIKAQKLPAGKHIDGSGLWLWKKSKDRGSWVLRVVVGGRRREAGLGPWPEVGIAEARERAAEMRKQVRDGIDPIDARRKAKHRTSSMTVKEAIESCFIAKQAELKGNGKHGRWMSPVKHVIAKIGNEPIESVDQHTIKQALGELWHQKPETARKALNRLGMSLTHASAHGLNVDLQAVLKAKALLGKQRQNVRHIPSLHYSKVPEFYKMLCAEQSMTCLSLRFLILTLARTSEIRFATYTEIKDGVWTIPAERTKAKSENRIPLTDEALSVIEQARIRKNQTLLFPSPNDNPISDATMSRFMERAGYKERPHGFRASFRSWAEETSGADYATMEASLGHVVGSEVVRAYQRSDLLEKRFTLLKRWTTLLTSHKNYRNKPHSHNHKPVLNNVTIQQMKNNLINTAHINTKSTRVIIFDLDGTLVANTIYHKLAWQKALNKYGIELSDNDFYRSIFGHSTSDIIKAFETDKYHSKINSDQLNERKEQLYRELYRDNIQPIEGLHQFISKLKERGIVLGVATSSTRENRDFVLNNLGIMNKLDFVVGGESVKRNKPDPEIYNLAIELSKYSPAECLAIEDTSVGEKSASSAGLRTIMINNEGLLEDPKLLAKSVKSYDQIVVD